MSRHPSCVVAILLIVFAACADGEPSPKTERAGTTDQGQPSKELIAAAGVERFPAEYGSNVSPPTAVVIPPDLDVGAIAAALGSRVEVTTHPPHNAYWQVMDVTNHGDYWEVDIASVDGSDYFRGPLFFRITGDGQIEAVSPEDVDRVAVTSVS